MQKNYKKHEVSKKKERIRRRGILEFIKFPRPLNCYAEKEI